MNLPGYSEELEEMEADVVVIGGGPAGIQATRFLKERRVDLEVAVLRPEPHSMVYCALPYAMEGLFPLERTFKKDELVTGVGAKLIRQRAVSLDLEGRFIALEDGRTLRFEKLLIATGASPLRPDLPGSGLDNVFTVKTAADAERIMARLPRVDDCGEGDRGADPEGRIRAVVVGSGAIGIEQAIAYRARGVEVHLVELRDHVLPHLLDSDMTRDLEGKLEEMGVEIYLSTALEGFEGDGEAERVRLSGGREIPLERGRDFAVLAMGMAPDIGVFADAGLEVVADGIVVDERMRTSASGVWAAGDCTAYFSGIDGKVLGGKLATNAVPMAKVAARDMLGMEARFPGFFNGAATVVGDLRAGGTGFTEAFARSRGLEVFSTYGATSTRFPMMPGAGDVRVKLVFEVGSGRLVGAQAVGAEAVAERIDLCTFAIQKGADAFELAELSYAAQPWQTFFPARNAIVEAATAARDILEGGGEVGGGRAAR